MEESQHLFQHSVQPVIRFSCTVGNCDKKFPNNYRLEAHRGTHFTSCQVCGKECRDTKARSKHEYGCRMKKMRREMNSGTGRG